MGLGRKRGGSILRMWKRLCVAHCMIDFLTISRLVEVMRGVEMRMGDCGEDNL